MSKSRDERRNPRFDVEGVPGKMAFAVDARVLNISRSGIALESDFQLVIGRRYEARIGLGESSVQTAGTVRRCRLKGTRKVGSGEVEPVYEAGIEFDRVLSLDQSKLMPIMVANASLQLTPRLHGRFSPQGDEKVTLESSVEFEVRRMSLSGLLMETDSTPEPEAIIDIEFEIDGAAISCAGRIADVSKISGKEGEEQRTRLGVEFLGMKEDDRDRLTEFLLGQLQDVF